MQVASAATINATLGFCRCLFCFCQARESSCHPCLVPLNQTGGLAQSNFSLLPFLRIRRENSFQEKPESRPFPSCGGLTVFRLHCRGIVETLQLRGSRSSGAQGVAEGPHCRGGHPLPSPGPSATFPNADPPSPGPKRKAASLDSGHSLWPSLTRTLGGPCEL